jgi:hypothetical protein
LVVAFNSLIKFLGETINNSPRKIITTQKDIECYDFIMDGRHVLVLWKNPSIGGKSTLKEFLSDNGFINYKITVYDILGQKKASNLEQAQTINLEVTSEPLYLVFASDR